MICCSSGKARVYYNIPIKGGLKYKIKGGWKTILADESLATTCVDIKGAFTGGKCKNKAYRVYYNYSGTTAGIGNFNQDSYFDTNGGVDAIDISFGGNIGINSLIISNGRNSNQISLTAYYLENGQKQVTGLNYVLAGDFVSGEIVITGISRLDETSKADDIAQCGGNKATKKFTITGTETGTKYLEIEVDECPDVQTIPCKFDPAKEQYIDVEMIPYTELPVNLPNYPLFQDCIEITSVGNFVVIEKVTTRNYGPSGDNDPSVRETRKIIKSLESPKGCPPPKVRVECCTTPDCQNNKKCPKGTTCELICNGFKCCYRNGKLIRSIKL